MEKRYKFHGKAELIAIYFWKWNPTIKIECSLNALSLARSTSSPVEHLNKQKTKNDYSSTL